MNPTGWGYAQVGWLLEEVRGAGGTIPDRYYPKDVSGEAPLREREAALAAARTARSDFGNEISDAFSWHRLHGDLTSAARAKARVRSLSALPGQAARLQRTLHDDPWLRRKLSDAIGFDNGIGLHEISEGLQRLAKTARDLAAVMEGTALWPELGMTAQELLFKRLAAAYRDGLDANPSQGTVKTYNAPSGPFVAFVRAAFCLAEQPDLTDPALYKALQRAGLIGRADNG